MKQYDDLPFTVDGANFERNLQDAPKRILVTGLPRCGTTWAASALGFAKETVFIDEPDDERRWRRTAIAKQNLGRYPVIAPGDEDKVGGYDITAYREMWEEAWKMGNEFAPVNLVIKSCLSAYCFEWVVETFTVDRTIWIDRFPLNTLSSWLEYGKQKYPDKPVRQLIKRMSWQYGMLYQTFTRLCASGYIAYRFTHEQLAADFTLFKDIAERCGLQWWYRASEWINDMDKEGEGGHWGLEEYTKDQHIHRLASEQRTDRWRSRLSDEEVDLYIHHLSVWPDVMATLARGAPI